MDFGVVAYNLAKPREQVPKRINLEPYFFKDKAKDIQMKKLTTVLVLKFLAIQKQHISVY